ncbi:MAG: CoA pyrophosphatase [Deltaproteobacteria bacterium]|nr:CoA pyrophosphatase [Deltaproteobacteria bacterium]
MKDLIINRLARAELGYGQEKAFICGQGQNGILWKEAGVLALLRRTGSGDELKSYAFVLNKRSAHVPQPGDLCFPGGHPHPWADRFMASVLLPLVLPLRKNPGFREAARRDPVTRNAIRFFLANALRESWEEMRLSPSKVEFLGALPAHRMATRTRIIYPAVGLISPDAAVRTGREIEKNVLLPLPELFRPENYGTYSLALTGKFAAAFGASSVDVPCFLVREPNGGSEILWGATLKIIMEFLSVVFDFTPPAGGPVRANAVLYPASA